MSLNERDYVWRDQSQPLPAPMLDALLMRSCARPTPIQGTWSDFYRARMELLARVQALRAAAEAAAAQAAEDAPTWATLADACGPDAADALDLLRDARARGRYPDDTAPHVNAHRLTFARWLVRQGILSEYC